MAFWIKNNDNVRTKWKTINNVVNILWIVAVILRFLIKLRDDANEVKVIRKRHSLGLFCFYFCSIL